MFNLSSELQQLVDDYPVSDAQKLQLTHQLEQSFVARLQSKLLQHLADEDIDTFRQLMTIQNLTPADFVKTLENNIDNIDMVIETIFEDFKEEFENN